MLVATDVAARGLDIPQIDLVVQCEPPKDVDDYIHRYLNKGTAECRPSRWAQDDCLNFSLFLIDEARGRNSYEENRHACNILWS